VRGNRENEAWSEHIRWRVLKTLSYSSLMKVFWAISHSIIVVRLELSY
jgi:hypothetical protein